MASKGVADGRPVRAIVASHDIVLFSSSYCPFCGAAISAIQSAGRTAMPIT